MGGRCNGQGFCFPPPVALTPFASLSTSAASAQPPGFFFLPAFSFVTSLPPPLSGGGASPAAQFCPPTSSSSAQPPGVFFLAGVLLRHHLAATLLAIPVLVRIIVRPYIRLLKIIRSRLEIIITGTPRGTVYDIITRAMHYRGYRAYVRARELVRYVSIDYVPLGTSSYLAN